MINLMDLIAQIPINVYVVLGCLVVGWVMKKFLPTDNRIIPVVLVILGAVVFVLIEGLSVQGVIIGAFTGAASTGLHQVFAQFIEDTKDREENLLDDIKETEESEDK